MTKTVEEASTETDEGVVHVLWMNGGLSCDGDSVALTAATQPSVEEIVLGALPGLPKIAVHWPLIDFECGPEQGADNFIEWWHKADRGELEPFVLIVEGSIPNESIKPEGYWAAFGNNPDDRPADARPPSGSTGWRPRRPRSSRSAPARRTAASTPCRATRPAPWACRTTSAGTGSRRPGCRSCACPGCPIHPDNLSETLVYLLYQVAGQAPMIPLDEALRPRWLFGATVHEGCDRAGYYEQGDFATEYGSPKCIVKLGCWGPVVKCNVPEARLDQRRRRLPERRRHLHRLHDARLPRQVHAVHGRAAGRQALLEGQPVLRQGRTPTAQRHRDTLDKEPSWRAKGELKTGFTKTW